MYSYFPVFQSFPAPFLLICSHNSHFRLKVFKSWCKTIPGIKFSPTFLFPSCTFGGLQALLFEQKQEHLFILIVISVLTVFLLAKGFPGLFKGIHKRCHLIILIQMCKFGSNLSIARSMPSPGVIISGLL